MRKLFVIIAAMAAALTGMFAASAPANADGSIVIIAGPGKYDITHFKPTGTITAGGGTISARCGASSLKGSAIYNTPSCATRVITCPTTATSCSVVFHYEESALAGPVAFAPIATSSGGFGSVTDISPYSCPKPNLCGYKALVTGIPPGSNIQAAVYNVGFNPTLAKVFAQASLTAH